MRSALAIATISFVFWLMLTSMSYIAIVTVHNPMQLVDYWLEWFSGLSLFGSVFAAIAVGVNLYTALGGE